MNNLITNLLKLAKKNCSSATFVSYYYGLLTVAPLLYIIPTAVMLLFMDCINTNANDSYLVSLGEGFCRRFP